MVLAVETAQVKALKACHLLFRSISRTTQSKKILGVTSIRASRAVRMSTGKQVSLLV